MTPPLIREPIAGMHCPSCEHLVVGEFDNVGGVTDVRADARRGYVEYRRTKGFNRPALATAIDRYGYRLGERPYWLNRTARVWRDVAIGVAIVGALALAGRAGALDFVGGWLNGLEGSSLLLPLLVGVAAGFSTCLATVGGLVLAASASASTARGRDAGMRPHLWFNAGRVAGFAGLGAIVGAIGGLVSLGSGGIAVLTGLAAVIMIAVSLQLTAVSPRLAALTPTLPRFARATSGRGARAGSRFAPDGAAAGLGVLSFFIPCGFTQAVQIYALSTGSPLKAGLILAAFAIGTAPALLALGGAPLLARGTFRDSFLRVAGVAVGAFAIVNLVTAAGMLGIGPRSDLALPDGITANVTIVDGVQIATMETDGLSYTPADTVVYADMPVQWEVTGTGLGCGSWIVAPQLGVPEDGNEALIGPGTTKVFEFTLTEPGTVDFACVMNMYRGTMTAIPQPDETGT